MQTLSSTLLLSLTLLPLVACGVDSASANGELGNLSFTLISDYYLDERDLTEASIVTGYDQSILVELTTAGEDSAGKKADEIEYRVKGSSDVEIDDSGADGDTEEGKVHSFGILGNEAGEVTVEAVLDGEVFDRIDFAFAAPTGLELVMFARAPYEEDFAAISESGTTDLEEGTQLAWLSIPTASGDRLLGNIVADMTAEPAASVVPAANVEHVNEDEAQSIFRADSLYFIAPGAVGVTLTDGANSVAEAAQLEVIAL